MCAGISEEMPAFPPGIPVFRGKNHISLYKICVVSKYPWQSAEHMVDCLKIHNMNNGMHERKT